MRNVTLHERDTETVVTGKYIRDRVFDTRIRIEYEYGVKFWKCLFADPRVPFHPGDKYS